MFGLPKREPATYQSRRAALHFAPVRFMHLPRAAVQEKSQPIGEIALNVAAALRADQAPESTLQPALRECVARAVRRYLHDLDSQMPEGLYDLVLREVETPLLREVLAWAGGNQSRAAVALGINRATLRKKLAALGLGTD
jgi:Fis family transcriptional regulator